MSSVHLVLQVEKAAWKFYKKAVADNITYMWRPSEDLRTLPEDGNFRQAVWWLMLSIRFWQFLQVQVCVRRSRPTINAIHKMLVISCTWNYVNVDGVCRFMHYVIFWKFPIGESMYISRACDD